MTNCNTTFRYDENGNKVPSISKPVPDDVRFATFGCINCLYQSCECKCGSRFAPDMAYDGSPSCKGYAYYD